MNDRTQARVWDEAARQWVRAHGAAPNRPWLVWLDGELFGDFRTQHEQLAAVTEAAAAGGEVSTSHWDPEGYFGPWVDRARHSIPRLPGPGGARGPVTAYRASQGNWPILSASYPVGTVTQVGGARPPDAPQHLGPGQRCRAELRNVPARDLAIRAGQPGSGQ